MHNMQASIPNSENSNSALSGSALGERTVFESDVASLVGSAT